MAKKKDLGISVEMLEAMNQKSDEENKKIRQLKEAREKEIERERFAEMGASEYIENRVVESRISIKKFDRKKERPIQKTVHLTIEVDNKVNMIKSVLKTLGKKTTFEDLLYDLLDEWIKDNYDEILSGKLIYPGEK